MIFMEICKKKFYKKFRIKKKTPLYGLKIILIMNFKIFKQILDIKI